MNEVMDYPWQKGWRITVAEIKASLTEHFALLEDPRAEHLTDHRLIDVIMIAICAVICMFINPVDSDRLASSVQRDYLKAAEQRRLMQNSQLRNAGIAPGLKVGLAITAIISLIVIAGQFLVA